ncbi:MAG: DMT family transporter, partial [Alphaproteobacteria bacterium]|nr:DMT family transporter [Alphaproteobacteria bacterium]
MAATDQPSQTVPLIGIGLYMVALTSVVGANTVGKITMDGLPLLQVVLAQIVGLFLAAFIAGRTLRIDRLLVTAHPGLQTVRTLCQFGAVVCFYLGLRHISLADITGIMLLLPLAITALAAVFLAEPVGWRRWSACLVGLAGAVLIARPGLPGGNPAALWPFVTVVLFALYTVLTRRLARDDPAPNLMLWASLATVLVLGLAAPIYWVTPDLEGWLGLLAVAAFSGLANSCRIIALSLAPASLLAPFGYTQIATATLVGLVVFGHLPDALSFAGIAVVCASG